MARWQRQSRLTALPSRQGGAVLLFSLIVLLLLTVIGVTAMQTTTLQERMAGGQRDRHLAVQGAEAAIREAERFLSQTATLPSFGGAANGLYHHAETPAPRWQEFDWDSGVINYEGGDMGGLLAEAPAYYIERLPPVADPSGSLAADESLEDTEFYRISARSTGGSGRSQVIIQVVYRR